MKKTTKLRQCMSCPWRKEVDPMKDIPNYSLGMHQDLVGSTIAREGDDVFTRELHVMACHKSKEGREVECVGWVANQLGPGNNIALRIRAMDGRYNQLELIGDQHETLEETIPDGND